jgi:hypothetical protein
VEQGSADVSSFRPLLQQQPRVYPRSPIPLFPLLTSHHSLATSPRPLFSYTYELPLPTHRFAGPLVSTTYELLFPQPLCFEKHLRCPIVFLAFPRNSVSSANSVVNRSVSPLPATHTKIGGGGVQLWLTSTRPSDTSRRSHPRAVHGARSTSHTLRQHAVRSPLVYPERSRGVTRHYFLRTGL